jgi:hypothetical protein
VLFCYHDYFILSHSSSTYMVSVRTQTHLPLPLSLSFTHTHMHACMYVRLYVNEDRQIFRVVYETKASSKQLIFRSRIDDSSVGRRRTVVRRRCARFSVRQKRTRAALTTALNEPDGDCDGKKTPQQKRSLFLSLSLFLDTFVRMPYTQTHTFSLFHTHTHCFFKYAHTNTHSRTYM